MKVYQIIQQRNFVEMIFHFSFKNDLFHRRGQKTVPIHFCNYVYTEIQFLLSFILFAQRVQLTHFLHDSF